MVNTRRVFDTQRRLEVDHHVHQRRVPRGVEVSTHTVRNDAAPHAVVRVPTPRLPELRHDEVIAF